MPPRKIELLAPAKNLEYGLAAVKYGADAVYIGGPQFGARSAAGNTIEDIGTLAEYAHIFGAKVYLALNTLLFDNETERAREIAFQAWEAGVDALIVQDMAFAEMDLPPIPLHASTQTFNISPERVNFLSKAGFSRVILERALNADEIRTISRAADVELEAFVHGAICVCYSGQCYMSQHIAGRSGNRGECIQPCRWDYSLTDEKNRKLVGNKHLLSVMDINLSERLETLIDAGVNSLKIEGRLKDVAYLKNNVAHYRRRIDDIISRRGELSRPSVGESACGFTPAPGKSFSRGFSEYFFTERDNLVGSFDTPKSVGEFIGRVKSVDRESFFTDSPETLSAGDGITFPLPGGGYGGSNINKSEGGRISPNNIAGIVPGTEIYRNHDHRFLRAVEADAGSRRIPVTATLEASEKGISLTYACADGVSFTAESEMTFEPAANITQAVDNAVRQVSKAGDTPYLVKSVGYSPEKPPFIPVSTLNDMRRRALSGLTSKRLSLYIREERRDGDRAFPYPEKEVDYRANVTNRLARRFYERHGARVTGDGIELAGAASGTELIRTRYCIRREIGQCLKDSPSVKGKLFLKNNSNTFELRFDCARCEMAVIAP